MTRRDGRHVRRRSTSWSTSLFAFRRTWRGEVFSIVPGAGAVPRRHGPGAGHVRRRGRQSPALGGVAYLVFLAPGLLAVAGDAGRPPASRCIPIMAAHHAGTGRSTSMTLDAAVACRDVVDRPDRLVRVRLALVARGVRRRLGRCSGRCDIGPGDPAGDPGRRPDGPRVRAAHRGVHGDPADRPDVPGHHSAS